jgi:hypothetical protein
MADFNVSLSGPSSAGANPVAPVHMPSKMNTAAPLLNFAGGLVEILGKNMEETKKQEKLNKQNAIISEYTEGLSSIAQAVETGQMTSAAASLKTQAFHRQQVASNPLFAEEFGKINKNLTEFSSLATVKSEQSMFEDAQKKKIADMSAAGYPVSFGMDKNLLEANIRAFDETQRAEGEFKRLAERQRLAVTLQGEERANFEFTQKQEANKALATMGDAHLESTMKNVQALVADFDKNGDVQGAAFKLQSLFTNIDSTLAALTSANPQAAKAYKDLFDGVKKLGEEGIKPGKSAEVWAQKLKLLENQTKFAALSASPEAKVLFSSSYLFHGNMPSTFLNMNTDGKNAYAALGNSFGTGQIVPQVVGTDNLGGTLEGLKHQIGQVKDGKVDNKEAVLTQAGNAANNILKQVGNASGIGIDPKKLAPAVSFLGSPEFLELHSQGKINVESLQGAKAALQVLYQKEVVKGVESKLGTSGGNLEFSFNGAGVVLQPKAGGKPLNYLEQGQRTATMKEMETTNMAINQLVRAGAHMEGHNNYQKYWEDNKHLIVPSYFPDPVKLKVGQVVDGYKYLGGNVKDQSSWMQEEKAKE